MQAQSSANSWPCPNCGAHGQRRVVGAVDWKTPMPGVPHYDILKCAECQVEYADPMPPDEVLAEYYANYVPTQVKENDQRLRQLMALQDPLVDFLAKFVSRDHSQPRFLDYGFGAGAFLLNLAGRGIDSTGIDYGRQNIEQFGASARELGLKVDLYDFLSGGVAQLKGQRFNCISLFQVIEHLQSPPAVINELRSLQGKGDYLYIECPNQDGFFFRLKNLVRPLIAREFMWGSVSPPQHTFGFNRRSLGTLLNKCGYELVEIGDYGMGDPLHAPETQMWYPTPSLWWADPKRKNFYGTAKMLIRLAEAPAKLFGAGGGLYALARAL